MSEQREKDRSFIGRRRAALRRAESAEIEPPQLYFQELTNSLFRAEDLDDHYNNDEVKNLT